MKKLLILILLIVITGCSKDIPLGADKEITEINIDGEMVGVEFTDDNTDEDIIIKSDKKDYWNPFGVFVMFFSVENKTGEAQSIDTVFSLKDGDILEIYEYDGYTEEEIEVEVSATSTELGAIEKKTKVTTKWKDKQIKEATKYKKDKDLLGATEYTRKDIKETDATKSFTDSFEVGEKKFYKAEVEIIESGKEEFFIETFGSVFGYGHLDPWSYTTDFESPTFSTGDLAGQDGWSVTGKLEVTTNSDYVFTGSQGVKRTTTSYVTKSITSTEGTVYIAMKYTNSSGFAGDGPFFQARDGGNYCVFTKVSNSGGNNYLMYYTSSGYIQGQQTSADTWYIIEINLDKDAGSNGEYTFRSKEAGGSWTTLSSSYGCGGNCSTGADQLRMGLDNNGTTALWEGGWDDISATDPDPPAPTPSGEVKRQSEFWF